LVADEAAVMTRPGGRCCGRLEPAWVPVLRVLFPPPPRSGRDTPPPLVAETWPGLCPIALAATGACIRVGFSCSEWPAGWGGLRLVRERARSDDGRVGLLTRLLVALRVLCGARVSVRTSRPPCSMRSATTNHRSRAPAAKAYFDAHRPDLKFPTSCLRLTLGF